MSMDIECFYCRDFQRSPHEQLSAAYFFDALSDQIEELLYTSGKGNIRKKVMGVTF
jgi:hypothetical protein